MKSFSENKHSKSSSIKRSLAKKKQLTHQYKLQQEIATEAARLIREEGVDSTHKASLKAAHILGVYDKHLLPDENDVLYQIKIHQSLFRASSDKQILKSILEIAFNTMTLLNSFEPKLIGPILQEYALEHSDIEILLRVDSPEDIAVFLMTHKIPYQLGEWKLYTSKPKSRSSSKSKMKSDFQLVPAYQFFADKHRINLIILTERNRKTMPLDPENWQAIQSASLAQVTALLDQQ